MVNKLSLSSFELDILKEIGNIGAGNAATALSNLVNRKIEMNVPSAQIVTFDEMMELAGGIDRVVAAVYLEISGDVSGNMFFVLPVERASLFIQQMLGSNEYSLEKPPYSEMALSAFQELGNILAGSYLSALADFLHMNLTPSVPAVSIDMFGAIISFGLIEISQVSDYAIVINTEIIDSLQADHAEKVFKGNFFLLPDPQSYKKFFVKLGVEL